MLMADTDTLPEAGRAFTTNLLAQVPGLKEGISVAMRLNLLLRHKSQESLASVLDDASSTLLANFGASDTALLDVLFGRVPPRGRLPFDLPSSMQEVENQRPDVPGDTANPLYRFGDGLDLPPRR